MTLRLRMSGGRARTGGGENSQTDWSVGAGRRPGGKAARRPEVNHGERGTGDALTVRLHSPNIGLTPFAVLGCDATSAPKPPGGTALRALRQVPAGEPGGTGAAARKRSRTH